MAGGHRLSVSSGPGLAKETLSPALNSTDRPGKLKNFVGCSAPADCSRRIGWASLPRPVDANRPGLPPAPGAVQVKQVAEQADAKGDAVGQQVHARLALGRLVGDGPDAGRAKQIAED